MKGLELVGRIRFLLSRYFIQPLLQRFFGEKKDEG
jgi:hypothetical protein